MKLRSNNYKSQQGFVMVLATITVLAGITITMGTLGRVLNDRQGSMRVSSSRNAKEAAEHGIAQIQERLNREYSSLLVYNDDEWPQKEVQICDNSKTHTTPGSSDPLWGSLKSGTVGSDASWSLESYNFNGNIFYGGEGTFLVKGVVEKSGKPYATSFVKQTVSIKPKPCGCRFNEGCSSGFPGLYIQEGTLGGNDVLGKIGGNVLCVKCETVSDLGTNPKSVIDGSVYLTAKPIPPVPEIPVPITDFPANALRVSGTKCSGNCVGVLDSDNNIKIESISGKTYPQTELGGNCIYTKKDNVMQSVQDFTDVQLICRVDALELRNNELIIDTQSNVPIAIYFTGSGDVFNSSGTGGIRHKTGSISPVLLQFFGNPLDNDDSNDQNATLRGAASSNNIFLHFPDGNLGIAGGATSDANCTTPDGECTGGDIYGAVWAKTWGQTSGASSGNGVQIVVPKDLANALGPDKAYITDYIAIGVNSWSNYNLD